MLPLVNLASSSSPTPLKDLLSTRDQKVETNLIEQVLVSNSSLGSGLSEASGVESSWVEVSQKVWKYTNRENSRPSSRKSQEPSGGVRRPQRPPRVTYWQEFGCNLGALFFITVCADLEPP